MQTIRNLAGRVRFQAVLVVLLVVTCGTPLSAWCGSENLWIANSDGFGIESFTSGQLKKSGMPAPIQVTTYSDTAGLAFDKSHNLWVVLPPFEVVQFTTEQLKNLKKDPNPTPGVIITSTSFMDIHGCNFDHQGNLWVVDGEKDSINELSKAQLAAGSGEVTPNIVITSADLGSPNFVTFDHAGNAWLDSGFGGQLVEFSASQLSSGGSKLATVLLSDDGSGTSLDGTGEIAFDKNGNLWVSNYSSNTVVEYAKANLTTSGDPAPTVKLSSAIFSEPWGTAFDSKDDLVVTNFNDGTIAKFLTKQLKVSGAPIPKISVTGSENDNYQIVFGPAS